MADWLACCLSYCFTFCFGLAMLSTCCLGARGRALRARPVRPICLSGALAEWLDGWVAK